MSFSGERKMKSVSAALRKRTLEQQQDTGQQNFAPLPEDLARKVALSWMDMSTMENAFIDMGGGVVSWSAAPPAQNAMAAIISDMMNDNARVFCVGFQSYGWNIASGMTMVDVMRLHIGKILPRNVASVSAEDTAAMIKKGPMNIVALHVDSDAGWQDVRVISAAAVKAEAPLLMVISAEIPAPEGVAIDVMTNMNQAASVVRDAMMSVRDQGAIRVIAMDDMTPSKIESAMMTGAMMTPQAWADAVQKNNDGAETAMNIAYRSPVEAF